MPTTAKSWTARGASERMGYVPAGILAERAGGFVDLRGVGVPDRGGQPLGADREMRSRPPKGFVAAS
jgi:hypothetical protein